MKYKFPILNYILLLLAGFFTSCEFDHLHYETSLLALVRIDVDWSKTELSPNGVSAFVYNSDGKLYKKELSSNPKVLFLKLPAGDFTVVLHNDDISEIGGVEYNGMSKFTSSSIYASKNSSEPSFEVENQDIETQFVNEPEDVASYTLRGVKVSAADVKYHYYKPNISDYEQEVTHSYTATPLHIVHRARVIAHIGGLEYAMGVPTAILRGMSGGYSFDPEATTDKSVTEEFKVNTRVSKVDDSEDDTIFVDYNTFGMHSTALQEREYYLDIRFTLLDGSHKDYQMDVTDNIRTEVTKTKKIHIIELELSPLPEVEEPDEDKDDEGNGEFKPSTDDWIDVGVDLPM